MKDIKVLESNLEKYIDELNKLWEKDYKEWKKCNKHYTYGFDSYYANEIGIARRKRMAILRTHINNIRININQIKMRNMNH